MVMPQWQSIARWNADCPVKSIRALNIFFYPKIVEFFFNLEADLHLVSPKIIYEFNPRLKIKNF